MFEVSNRQSPAVRHGVASIDGEIHDDLLDLPGSKRTGARFGAQMVASWMSSPTRRRIIFSTLTIASFRSRTRGAMNCLRENDS